MTRLQPAATAATAVAVLVMVVAACGPVEVGEGSPSPAGAGVTAPPVTSVPSPAATTPPPVASTPPATDRAPSGVPEPSATVEEDERLLAVLPETVDGTAVELVSQGLQEAMSEPGFVASIDRAAFFIAPGPENLVSGLVAQPRPGVFGEDWYRDWRETYDEGACAQAGGIGGRAEAAIGGRPVQITTCSGDMRVYHAWVVEQGVVVSLISLGEGRWGERVMASLRP